jgi:hypothetical protein
MELRHWRIAARLAAVVLFGYAGVSAHHSNITFYEMDKEFEVSGIVVQLRLINPHINLRIEATEPNGAKVLWIFDGPNASASRANGWHEKVLTPGEKVKVVAHPARNPAFKGGYGARVIKADGSVLDFGRGN